MTDDPRKPKIIIPEDANFMAVRKYKQTLDGTAPVKEELPVLEGMFMEVGVKDEARNVFLERYKAALERYIRQQKEKKNG